MMATKRNIFVIVLLTIGLKAYSQGGQIMNYLDPNFQNLSLIYPKNIADAPYLVLEFSPGQVIIEGGKIVKDVELQYDIEKQLLLIKIGKEMGIIDSKLVKSFEMTLPGTTTPAVFIPKPYGNGISFFQVLSDGDVKVLKKSDKKKRSTEAATATGYNNDGPKPAAFLKTESYFLLISDQLTPIKLSKKSILSALKDPKYETCAKSYDLKLNSVEELTTLLNDCK